MAETNNMGLPEQTPAAPPAAPAAPRVLAVWQEASITQTRGIANAYLEVVDGQA